MPQSQELVHYSYHLRSSVTRREDGGFGVLCHDVSNSADVQNVKGGHNKHLPGSLATNARVPD
jgi:hypothetical protein